MISFNSIQVRCFVVKTMSKQCLETWFKDLIKINTCGFFWGDSFGARHGTSKGLPLVTSTPETTYFEHTANGRNPTPVGVGSFFYPISQVVIGFWFTITSYHRAKSRFPYLAAAATSALGDAKRLASWAAFEKVRKFDIQLGVPPFPWFWDIWAVARTACWLAVETWIVKGGNTPLCWQTVWRKSAANLCTSHFLAISPDDLAMLHVSLFQRVTSKKVNHKTYPQTST